MEFEEWLKSVCFQRPTPEAYDLAKDAWAASIRNLKAPDSFVCSIGKPYSCDCRNMMPEDAPLCDCGKNITTIKGE